MVTGLIYAAIVVLWAAYLVPLALRRYDEASHERSIDSFSPRMRMLRRGDAEPEADESPAPAAPPVEARPQDPPTVNEPVQRASTRIAVRRRRRTLVTLLLATSVVGGLCGGGIIPWWSVTIPAALVVAWLVACRIQVIGEEAADHTALGDRPDDEPTIVLSGQLEDFQPERKNVMLKAPLDDADLEERVSVAVPFSTADGQSLWDPVPVTLPTYVDKPRAERTIRTIDFNGPDAWTSGHVDGETTEMPDDDADTGRRRAVGD
ncbi:MAG: divisome protein SepX/GlpR [Nocardioidaceae bacterium]